MTTEYLIDFEQTATPDEIQEYLATNSCVLIRVFSVYDKVYLVTSEVEPPKTAIVTGVINNSSSLVKPHAVAEVLRADVPTATIVTEDEKNWWKIYSLNNVNFEQSVQTIKRFGAGGVVYMVDSGIEKTHPEFDGVDIEQLYSFTGTFVDTTGHGTALASVISGKTCGLTDATIKDVKIFDSATPTHLSDLVAAFSAILTDFLSRPNSIGVVNLSWSIDKNTYIEEKIQTLIDLGMIVIASSGNGGVPIDNVTPAEMADVITIGSYNQDFNPSDFSNYSDGSIIPLVNGETNYGELDGWAPGEKIWAAQLGGGYGFAAGTSIAAAIASGASVYDLGMVLVDEDRVIPPTYVEALKQFWFRSSTALPAREGFLNLDDEKYKFSVNRIVTYKATMPLTQYPSGSANFINGQFGSGRIYFPLSIKSIEYKDEDLPAGLWFEGGFLVGTPNVEIPEIGYTMRHVPLKLTTINDESFALMLSLSIRSPDLDISTLPADDPLMVITLALVCSATTYTASNLCTTHSCGSTLQCEPPVEGKTFPCICNG